MYDEMMKNDVDTVEHVIFGFWLMNKIRYIERNTPFAMVDIEKRHFEEVKQKLPEGIKNIFFEPFVMFGSKTKELLRGFRREDSVRFSLIPSNKGRYFQIQETKENLALFIKFRNNVAIVEAEKASKKKNSKKERDTSYYWQIIPTQNAKYFIIKSYSEELAISSKGSKRCVEYVNVSRYCIEFFAACEKKCSEYEKYPITAFALNEIRENVNDSQLWTITPYFIRN